MMINSIRSNTQFNQDVVEWDVSNWTRALLFWEKEIRSTPNEKSLGLEIGSRKGGISLYFAKNGYQMITTDIQSPEPTASPLHRKYKVTDRISYGAMAGGTIPDKDHFDLITFKSVLGAICSNENIGNLKPTIQNMYDALKPGGLLVFAENIYATPVHNFMRKHFVKWGDRWNYLKLKDIIGSLDQFSEIRYTTVGFLACFGRNERQKRTLARLDQIIEPFIPKKSRYIVAVVAVK